jgi:large subunit ribosomal protein L3
MAKTGRPRSGSMGMWPRKRSKKSYPRIRGWSNIKLDKPNVLGFAGYKVGMTHVIATDNQKTSITKGQEISIPVSIVECPPIKILSARLYKKDAYGEHAEKDIMFKTTKDISKKLDLPKKFSDVKELDAINPDEYSEITVVVHTQPNLAGLGKKKPELFEMKLYGSNKEKIDFIKENVSKDVALSEIFSEGVNVDVRAVTKGKGTQGPVKRFGIGLKAKKSEKGQRQPGSRGGWKSQQHVMYRTAYSGQTGYHPRIQLNTQILKISNDPKEVNPADGFPHYGKVKTTYMLVKGSIPGAKKRLVILTQPTRHFMKPDALPTINEISLQSKQGR